MTAEPPAADPLAEVVRAQLSAAADPAAAPGMQRYMKSAMPFLGVRVPNVRRITRTAARQCPPQDIAAVRRSAIALFDEATHREHRYAALAVTGLPMVRGEWALLDVYRHFAVTGAWWDIVDDTAHRIADLHDAHPERTAAVVRGWCVDPDLWLRRLAILGQLGRKHRVDPTVLADTIEPNLPDPDFFIRKAIGWALREYARVQPEWVLSFVAAHDGEMSPLSRREACKHLPAHKAQR